MSTTRGIAFFAAALIVLVLGASPCEGLTSLFEIFIGRNRVVSLASTVAAAAAAPHLDFTIPLPAATWGTPGVNQSFPYGLHERVEDGKIFLVGTTAFCQNQTAATVPFRSQCLLAVDPTRVSSPTIWEQCSPSPSGAGGNGTLVLQLSSKGQLFTCESEPLLNNYTGYSPTSPIAGCKPDADLVVTDWTTKKDIARLKIAPPPSAGIGTGWNFSLGGIIELSVETGRVVVAATNATNATNHALLLLNFSSVSPTLSLQWALQYPMDQNQVSQGEPDGPCWSTRFFPAAPNPAANGNGDGDVVDRGFTMGFAPGDKDLFVAGCGSGYTGSPSGEGVDFVVVDASSGEAIGAWGSSARFYTRCTFLSDGPSNGLECFPGGDCFNEAACDARTRARLVRTNASYAAVQQLGAVRCGGQEDDGQIQCSIFGAAAASSDRFVVKLTGYREGRYDEIPCEVSVRAWSNASLRLVLAQGSFANSSGVLAFCDGLPAVVLTDARHDAVVLARDGGGGGGPNNRTLELHDLRSGHLRGKFELIQHVETRRLVTSSLPQGSTPAAQMSADGTVLFFWAIDNSTAGMPKCWYDRHGTRLYHNASVLVAVDVSEAGSDGKFKLLWAQHYDFVCDAPLLFQTSRTARRFFVVEGGALATYSF